MIDQRRNCEQRDIRKMRTLELALYSVLAISTLAITHTIYAAL